MPVLFGTITVAQAVVDECRYGGRIGVLAKAKTMNLIPSFSSAAYDMREQGIYFSEALIRRIAQRLGEPPFYRGKLN